VKFTLRAPVTRDEQAQEPEREGMARALGELVTCPYCIGLWVAAGLSGAMALPARDAPRDDRVRGAGGR
jgi:hypothetical protein